MTAFSDYLILISASAYLAFVLFLLSGWWLTPRIVLNAESQNVSIIICMRNESESVCGLLTDLVSQHYPTDKYEIIVSDDFSEDDSAEKVMRFMERHPHHRIRLIQSGRGDLPGKKYALVRAVALASNDIIALTDADCRMGPHWLSTMVSSLVQLDALIAAGPVSLTGKGFFARMQQIEMMSLSASAAATLSMKKPMMINAANMVFSRQAFFEAGRMNPEESSASGDDTFFMLKVAAKNPGALHFVLKKDAMVYSPAVNDLRSFLQQRIRWASKTAGYSSAFIRAAGLFLFLFNSLLVAGLLLGWMVPRLFTGCIVLFAVKIFCDVLFLLSVNRFYGCIRSIFPLAATLLIHPVYMTVIPLLALRKKYEWKGRNYTN